MEANEVGLYGTMSNPFLRYSRLTLALLVSLALPVGAGERAEERCGWFDNPSPGNISLWDRDGEWVIGIQGDYQMKGDWPWPTFPKSTWVSQGSGSYGHGCVCMHVVTDPPSHSIVRIDRIKPQPLTRCRKDRALQEP